jgi:hypothetical protein
MFAPTRQHDGALTTPGSPRPFVFVLMPFDRTFGDTYQLGIRAACEAAGAYCERVDEQVFTENILARITNQIAKADIVVADMSERNPKVFYETGYAHALGKTVILLTRHSEDIPFDLRQYPHIVYADSLVSLRDQLQRKIRFFLDNPRASPVGGVWSLELFHEGRLLRNGDTVVGGITHSGFLSVIIDKHNPAPKPFHSQNTIIALLSSGLIMREVHSKERSVKLPDGRLVTTLPGFPNLHPDAWAAYRFDLKGFEKTFRAGERFPVTLRFYTGMGPIDLPLVLEAGARLRRDENADEDDG